MAALFAVGLLLLLLPCVAAATVAPPPEVRLVSILVAGGRLPYDMYRAAPAITMGIERARRLLNDSATLRHEFVYGGSSLCTADYVGAIAAEMYYRRDVAAFVGPGCSFALEHLGRMAAVWGVPVVTSVGTNGVLGDKRIFATLTRLSYNLGTLSRLYIDALRFFGWRHTAIVYDVDFSFARIVGSSVYAALTAEYYPSLALPFNAALHQREGTYDAAVSDMLLQAATVARVIIVSGSADMVRYTIMKARELGLTNGEYVYITTLLFESAYFGDVSWYREWDTAENNEIAKEAFQSVLRISLLEPTDEAYLDFANEVKERAFTNYNFTYGSEPVNPFIGGFHDSVLLYAHALKDLLADGGDPRSGHALTALMWNRTFTGITGEVVIDANGDRASDYSLLDMHPVTGEWHVAYNYYGARKEFEPTEYAIHWPAGRTDPPPDEPECGFRGDDPVCESKEEGGITSATIAIISFSVILVIGGAICFMLYRKMKLESDLRDTWWKVSWQEVNLTKEKGRRSASGLSIPTSAGSAVSVISGQQTRNQIFTKVGTYRAKLVAVRETNHKLDINRKVLMEFKKMRDVSHDNLNRFVGVVQHSDILYVLTDYAPKGSLQDILGNDAIKLDATFKHSLINDLVQGMTYIHESPISVHGHLKSSNAVIDSRFVLKITDFGLPMIRDVRAASQQPKDLLWTAPEILRSGAPYVGTQKGDVYSFGIMLQEIVLRCGPYESNSATLDAPGILEMVTAVQQPPYRPVVSPDECLAELYGLMQEAWHEVATMRPTFPAVKRLMRSINKNGGGNILDNLLMRMEQYATDLEALVEERTDAFLEEKRRAETLLYQILPRSVADQLKQGKSVEAESFDSTTIYFSDIVGFTSMSAASTPMQVVNLLNDLYTCFDGIIDHYDVYKVETIGDAYMVVSGLPVKNGITHAREIARMSLALLSAIQNFRIRHQPEDSLKLRIGIHSGPSVAGVVGLKMPRYCLFGDTVNTASRMESNGLAMRIHVSSETKAILDTFDTFVVELRGNVEMKGKGTVTTYWLLGEKNQRKATKEGVAQQRGTD